MVPTTLGSSKEGTLSYRSRLLKFIIGKNVFCHHADQVVLSTVVNILQWNGIVFLL